MDRLHCLNSMRRSYLRVLVVWIVTLAGLYWFQRAFS
jgi:hypothetical protein